MLAASRDEGLIEEVAHQLLTGALDLGDRSITTVMVPRDRRRVAARDGDRRPRRRPSSCPPATRGCWSPASGLDDVLGFVHAKDLLDGARRGTGPPAARSGGSGGCSC